VLALGAATTIVVTVAVAAPAAWRAARDHGFRAEARPRREPLLALATAGGSAPRMIGIQLALRAGSGPAALPVRSTIAGAVIGVAGLAAALTLTASLGHLLATPRLYGVTWDAVASPATDVPLTPVARLAARDPDVAGWSEGFSDGSLQITGHTVDALALGGGTGPALLATPLQGRLPRATGEISLGPRTLTLLHTRIGGTVAVALARGRPVPMRVVGSAVFPAFSDGLGLGQGAALTLAAQLTPAGAYSLQGPPAPTDLVNFGRVRDLPLLLGAALSALALLTVTHLLVTSVRRRRRDFAVLRVLGCTTAQLRASAAWQASTLTVLALAIGIPLGILGGRLAWQAFARYLGVLPVPALPVPLLLLAAAALVLALLVAVFPARSAARTRPAPTLHTE
jgi:hypothetical protein